MNQIKPGIKETANIYGEGRPVKPDEIEIGIPSHAPANTYYLDREFLRSTQLDTTKIDEQIKMLKDQLM